MKPKTISIVCGHFLPELGYIEVDLAKSFERLGHQVHVITSDVVPAYVKSLVSAPLKVGTLEEDGYLVHRLKSQVVMGQIVVSSGIKKKLEDMTPDLVLVIGLGKRFPLPILTSNRSWKLACLIGDNSAGYRRKPSLIDRVFKDPVYKKAVASSDLIFSYTSESKSIVAKKLKQPLKTRLDTICSEISLGFDSEIFSQDNKARVKARSNQGYAPTDNVAITATRATSEKHLDVVLKKMDEAIENGVLKAYHLIGLSTDSYSQELKTIHRKLKQRDHIHLHNMMDHQELNTYLNMADLGVWTRPAISMFQALGTGLPLILPMDKSVDHILQTGEGCRQQAKDINVNEAFKTIKHSREQIAQSASERFSTISIAQSILNQMMHEAR